MTLLRAASAAVGLAAAAFASGYATACGGERRSSSLTAAQGIAPTAVAAAAATSALLPTPATTPQSGVPGKPTPTPPPTSAAERARQILRFGAPTSDGVKFFDDFVLAYDRRLRLPVWVFERLEPGPAKPGLVNRDEFEFYEDLGQHPYFRASNADFAGSGYDRGHMAAAGNHKRERSACQQTFILSNICPQVGQGFNRHLWNSLERYIRSLARHYSAIYVCSGPLFLPVQPRQTPGSRRRYVQYEVLGDSSVAVPTHFFKVVLLESPGQQYELLSYVVPNMAHPTDPEPSLDLFLVPLDSIERSAGFLIFDQLPKNRLVRVNKRTFVGGV